MKIEIPLSKTTRLINSGQLILITSGHNGKKNIATIAWHMPASYKPPLVAVAIAKAHLTSQLITQQKEFAINVPDLKLLDQVLVCGSRSGREIDKFKESKLTAAPAHSLKETPLIQECIGHIECHLQDTHEIGDHYVFIGEPLYACAEQELFDETWKASKAKLIFHLGGRFFTTCAQKIQKL